MIFNRIFNNGKISGENYGSQTLSSQNLRYDLILKLLNIKYAKPIFIILSSFDDIFNRRGNRV